MLTGGYGFDSGTGKHFFLALKLKVAVGFIILKSYRWDYHRSHIRKKCGGRVEPKLRIYGALPPLLH
jgi:hypothetical protein